jgi:hypothetical protein
VARQLSQPQLAVYVQPWPMDSLAPLLMVTILALGLQYLLDYFKSPSGALRYLWGRYNMPDVLAGRPPLAAQSIFMIVYSLSQHLSHAHLRER